ncbi:dienelactone hydrolase [Rhodofomes roseus]|uniref:Dienelactone hydrolase n=1 Tax=Rhodofomes roseus TaxID=34475 RepID=A0ABQ8KDC4_9APHY|nr:dienelactone hydrolase [Rhodofomes roseus]KAH9835598.1 dienelactone hydrolase [Rhodofomes roseus]
MLIKTSYHDVPSKLDPNGNKIRIFVISPNLPSYPHAKFPGVVVFSEIYQVTGPVERFAGQIASQGYVVACPSSFHEFDGPEPIPYDTEATGMCLGGHLAFRAAFDPRILSSVCWFATDVHSATLGKGKNDDSLVRVRNGDLTGKELVMVFGKQDTHVPRAGRDFIRKTLEDANVTVSFFEVQAQHAFIRDQSSKDRWDAALTRSLFGVMMEVFERTVARDLGPKEGTSGELEHVC